MIKKIVSLKFDENDSLRDKLLKTKGWFIIYEATKADMDFACGLTSSQAKDIAKNKSLEKNSLVKYCVTTETTL